MAEKKRIGELLLDEGVITEENIKEALKVQKEKGGLFGTILLDLGYIDKPTLVKCIARQNDMSIARLKEDLEDA